MEKFFCKCKFMSQNHRITKSQNHRTLGVGRDLCGSSSPTPPAKAGKMSIFHRCFLGRILNCNIKKVNWEMWLKILEQLPRSPVLSKGQMTADFIFPVKILRGNWNISSFLTKGFQPPQSIPATALFTELKETHLIALFISLSIACSVYRKRKMLHFISFIIEVSTW